MTAAPLLIIARIFAATATLFRWLAPTQQPQMGRPPSTGTAVNYGGFNDVAPTPDPYHVQKHCKYCGGLKSHNVPRCNGCGAS